MIRGSYFVPSGVPASGMKQQNTNICFFCGSPFVLRGTINSTYVICEDCTTKIELNLKLPVSPCHCQEKTNLIPVYYNEESFSFCPSHLPVPAAIELARQLTSMYGYNNAPSWYESKENFDLIEAVGRNNILQLDKIVLAETVKLAKDLNVLKKILSGINNHKSLNHQLF